ncbi:MAG: FAD-binding protein [Pseudomonadota bacterium]
MGFDETWDVIVVGFGHAGGISAINAADQGARTLVVEKSPVPGGLSICSYGAVRSARDREGAYDYLTATCAGRTPAAVLRTLADGMCELEAYVRELARVNGAVIETSIEQNAKAEASSDPYRRRISANYPLPGTESFYHTSVIDVPGFDARAEYPWANGAPNGPKLFKVVHDNVARRGIEVRLATPAQRLVTDPATREVLGIEVGAPGATRRLRARRGVVLACGGFEANGAMKQQFFEGQPVLNAAARCNEGDGIRMAQALGAGLWHMWHVHGAYGFRHTDPSYPYGIRAKRFPDWFPGESDRPRIPMAWILLDRFGRRFMSEYQPYSQDTCIRPLMQLDPVTQSFPRNPAFLVCDEAGRRLYPLGKPTSNDPGIRYEWSEDNLREVDNGILTRAATLEELFERLGFDADAVRAGVASIARWNTLCAAGRDEDFGRPPGSMRPIIEPPFIGAPVHATLSNTQGGPVHDEHSRILDVWGEPIPRLYAAGEMGSAFGHLYFSGANIAECFVTGRVAGSAVAREAAGAWA